MDNKGTGCFEFYKIIYWLAINYNAIVNVIDTLKKNFSKM